MVKDGITRVQMQMTNSLLCALKKMASLYQKAYDYYPIGLQLGAFQP
jgi:hypothetical protein